MNVTSALLITNIATLACLLILTLYFKIPRKIIKKIIEPQHGLEKFMKMVNAKMKGEVVLLDVGCGNNSPFIYKTSFPNIKYTGIDVSDYNQTKPILADEYIITSPENFTNKLNEFDNSFNTIISSHNLEHCNDRNGTLAAMAKALKKGGYLYLSFPTEKSVNFPGPREGSLNYYDDFTHKGTPPNFSETLEALESNSIEIIFSDKSYKPFFYYIIGMLKDKKSSREKKAWYSTWAYYGFEAIIWGRKK
jgi:SAM-dependent methyltransferase